MNLKSRIEQEMQAYYDGEYSDHSVARSMLESFAADVISAERESTNGNAMNCQQQTVIAQAISALKHVAGESDQDDACLRVARRMLAEVLGLPLGPFRLLMENDPILPRYMKAGPPANTRLTCRAHEKD